MKELPINQIICGDCLEVMNQMSDESVDMVMTSPPYWGLRDYGIEQIFGGDKDCEHEWQNKIRKAKKTNWNEGFNMRWEDSPTYSQKQDKAIKIPEQIQGFCSKCHAWKGQLGLEPTPELYIEHLTEIFNEAKRVLKKEGTLWLNIGDTYWGGKGKSSYPLPHNEDKRYREGKTLQHGYQVPGYMEMRPPDGKHDFIQPKCLTMIPERLAWSLIQNGWILRNKIVWYKPNAMPSSVKDRFSNRWEGIFLFVKSSDPVYWTNKKTLKLVINPPLGIKGKEGEDWKWGKCPSCGGCGKITKEVKEGSKKCSRCNGSGKIKVSFWTAHDYYFDLDAVREPHKYDGRKDTLYKGGPKDMQIGKHERWPDPAGKNPGDVIKIERKWNEVPGQITQSIAQDHGGWYRKDGFPIVDFEKGKNPGDFWDINTQPFPEAHFAVFPEKLCEKPIKAGCPEQVCKKCGNARERIIEKEVKFTSGSGKAGNPPKGKHENSIQSKSGSYDIRMGPQISTKTIGWSLCNCNADFEPGIVLDPFAGAGTVGVVAKKLGRQFILIDIKKEYCKMAEKRIAQVGHQMELRV